MAAFLGQCGTLDSCTLSANRAMAWAFLVPFFKSSPIAPMHTKQKNSSFLVIKSPQLFRETHAPTLPSYLGHPLSMVTTTTTFFGKQNGRSRVWRFRALNRNANKPPTEKKYFKIPMKTGVAVSFTPSRSGVRIPQRPPFSMRNAE